MFDFLTPDLFSGLVWAVILIGGALAILRMIRDLSGPPRFPEDRQPPAPGSSGPPGPNDNPPSPDANDERKLDGA